MKHPLLVVLICLLQVACSTFQIQSGELPAIPDQRVTSEPLPTAEDIYQVKAWVINPTPPQNSLIVVRGSLMKNGAFLGGIMMQASWLDDKNAPGMPNCTSLVTYGTGKCIIDTGDFPVGKYVPITVTFDYNGKKFIAQTGFTPRIP
jgi:hypothetical protein